MVLAAALGLAGPEFASDAWPTPSLDRSRVALVGTRSLEQPERELIGARLARLDDEHDRPARCRAPMREAIEHVAGDNFTHVSLDMDVLNPDIAPGVGTAVRGGLDYREAHLHSSSSPRRTSSPRSTSSR